MFTNYVQYSPITGAIISWGRGTPPDTDAWIENTQEGDLRNYLVNTQTLNIEMKTTVTPTITQAQAQADGQDYCEITGIPTDTMCTISMPGGTRSVVTCSDGSLEITSLATGPALIKYWHYAYIMPDQQVEFI